MSTTEFGARALVADQMTTEQRLYASLIGDLPQGDPRALTPMQAGKMTTARIRYAMAELVGLNVDNVHRWLAEVAKDSPAKAIELMIELAQFSVPKLKAVSVDMTSSDGSVKTFSIAELEKIVSEQ